MGSSIIGRIAVAIFETLPKLPNTHTVTGLSELNVEGWMSYDGFSSQELLAIARTNEMSTDKLSRFVILWHSMPTIGEIRQGTEGTQNAGSVLSSLQSLSSLSQSGIALAPRTSHFDLMFEVDEHLITFELPKLPIPGDRIPLRRLKDHRLHYLDYQGALEPGAHNEDRGHVTQWTSGSFHHYRWTEQKLIVELTSLKLSARIVLLPGKIVDGVTDTRSPRWPGVLRWELRAPRWEVRKTAKTIAPDLS